MPPIPPSGFSLPDPEGASEACPGCGAVLASSPGSAPGHPGASASCSRLFEVTVGGLREEAQTDPSTAPLVRLADAAYDAQHPVAGEQDRLQAALQGLAEMLRTRPVVSAHVRTRPRTWRTTVADAAADLDVIDLPILVESWARAVHEDWASTHAPSRDRSVT